MPGDNRLSRRQVLAYGGAVGITTLAGCSSDEPGSEDPGDDTENNDSEPDQQEQIDATYTSWMSGNPEEFTNWNRWDPTAIKDWSLRELMFCKLAHKDTSKQEYMPYLAESWDISGDTITVSLRDGQEWHDGTPFTAEDVVTHWDLTRLTGSLPGALSEVRAEDELSVEFVFENEVNPIVAQDTVFLTEMWTPAHVYSDYVERLEDAADEDEQKEIQNELQNFSIEDPHKISNGLWKLENRTASKFSFELHEPHFAASDINFTGYETRHIDDGQTTQAIQQGELDWAPGDVPQHVLDNLPDHVQEVPTNAYGGSGAMFNSEVDELNDYRVTQALTHAVGPDRIADLGGPQEFSITEVRNTGIIPPEFNDLFSDDEVEQLTDYSGRNTDVATSLLEEAGFERSDDVWIKPDGDEFEMKIIAWAAEDTARIIADHLSDFGIETEVLIQDAGAIWSNYLQGSESWDLVAWGWGSPTIQGAAIWSYERSFAADGVFASNTGTPEEIDIPWPPFDPDGVSTVNTSDMVTEYQQTVDEDEATELLKGLAWAYNQYIPNMQLSLNSGIRLMSYDRWDMPDSDDPIMGVPWPPYTLHNLGLIGAEQ